MRNQQGSGRASRTNRGDLIRHVVRASLALERCVLIKLTPRLLPRPGRSVLAVDVSRRPPTWFARGRADPKINPTVQRQPVYFTWQRKVVAPGPAEAAGGQRYAAAVPSR